MPGPPELILILVIVLIVFGAGRIPQVGDALGKGIRNFKRAISGKSEIDITPTAPKAIDGDSPPAAGEDAPVAEAVPDAVDGKDSSAS